jgi:hypothetical protein
MPRHTSCSLPAAVIRRRRRCPEGTDSPVTSNAPPPGRSGSRRLQLARSLPSMSCGRIRRAELRNADAVQHVAELGFQVGDGDEEAFGGQFLVLRVKTKSTPSFRIPPKWTCPACSPNGRGRVHGHETYSACQMKRAERADQGVVRPPVDPASPRDHAEKRTLHVRIFVPHGPL